MKIKDTAELHTALEITLITLRGLPRAGMFSVAILFSLFALRIVTGKPATCTKLSC